MIMRNKFYSCNNLIPISSFAKKAIQTVVPYRGYSEASAGAMDTKVAVI